MWSIHFRVLAILWGYVWSKNVHPSSHLKYYKTQRTVRAYTQTSHLGVIEINWGKALHFFSAIQESSPQRGIICHSPFREETLYEPLKTPLAFKFYIRQYLFFMHSEFNLYLSIFIECPEESATEWIIINTCWMRKMVTLSAMEYAKLNRAEVCLRAVSERQESFIINRQNVKQTGEFHNRCTQGTF